MAEGTEDGDRVTVKADEAGDHGGEGGRERAFVSTADTEEGSSLAKNVRKITDHAVVENDRDKEQEAVLKDGAEREECDTKEEAAAAGIDAAAAGIDAEEVTAASNDAEEVAAASSDAEGIAAAGNGAKETATANSGADEARPTSADAGEQAAAPVHGREAKEVDPLVSSTGLEESKNALHERCEDLATENDVLIRRVARLRQQLYAALDTAQTHGQRLLRAAFQEKVRKLTTEHNVKTTQMLNMQKKCFEEELEAMGMDSQMAVREVQRELEVERGLRKECEERYRKERELTLEKTTATMVAVQRKLAQLHARATRLEREKKSLVAAVAEKQMMIEVVASAAAAKDVERRRVELLSRTSEEERLRKEGVVERLETEVRGLRDMLAQERKVNANLVARIEDIESAQGGTEKEAKEGAAFAGVGQDFVNVQSDVSTGE